MAAISFTTTPKSAPIPHRTITMEASHSNLSIPITQNQTKFIFVSFTSKPKLKSPFILAAPSHCRNHHKTEPIPAARAPSPQQPKPPIGADAAHLHRSSLPTSHDVLAPPLFLNSRASSAAPPSQIAPALPRRSFVTCRRLCKEVEK
jgi:hypothetical protein